MPTDLLQYGGEYYTYFTIFAKEDTLVNTRIHQNALHNVQGVSEKHGHFQIAIFGIFFFVNSQKKIGICTTQKFLFLKKHSLNSFFL